MGRGVFIRVRTGFSIHPNDWSEVKGFPKQNDAANKELTGNLKKLEKHILDSINQAQAIGEEITKELLERGIENCFSREKKDDTSFVTYQVQYIIDNASTRKILGKNKIGLAENTIKNYQTFKQKILEFEIFNKKKLRFKDISPELVEKFKNWLLDVKVYSLNHAGKQLAFLKSVSKDVDKMGVSVNSYAFKIEAFSESNDDRNIVTLSFKELDQIEKTHLEREALINARKWLLLGCELGQRGEDLLKIKPSDIRITPEGKIIDVYQKKGKKYVAVPVSPRAQRVLDLGFPNKISLQNLNDYIKDVAEEAKLVDVIEGKKFDKDAKRKISGMYPKYQLVTSHTCRRSFATNYDEVIPRGVVMQITGHVKESTFLQYIGKPKDKDENAKLFLKYVSM